MNQLNLRIFECDVAVYCNDSETLALLSGGFSALVQPRAGDTCPILEYTIKRTDGSDHWSIVRSGLHIECRSTADLLYNFEKDMTIQLQLVRRGLFFVHAAAVSRADECAVIAGESGAGKSTLCWSLCHSGFDYMSDELAPLQPADGMVEAYPHAVCLKRRPEKTYPLPEETIETAATLHVPAEHVPSSVRNRPASLKALFFLEKPGSNPGGAGIRKLQPGEAALRLYSNSLNQLAHPGDGLKTVITIVKSVPCILLERGPVARMAELFEEAFDSQYLACHLRAG